MRLFNDMVTAILACDKPVICRVNGMRIGGGQEIGMACDFSVASDSPVWPGRPGHGSAPDGGSTDFLPLFVGRSTRWWAATLCEPWTAHKALGLGLITGGPGARGGGKFIPNPLVVTDRWLTDTGNIVFGELKEGRGAGGRQGAAQSGEVDLSLLDDAVDARWHEAPHDHAGLPPQDHRVRAQNTSSSTGIGKESNRAWLALNMLTEAKAGFPAFHEGRAEREVDFVVLGSGSRLGREAWA